MNRTRFYITALAVISFAPAAWAQERVSVRIGAHEGYDRLVFDWPTTPPYSVTAQGQSLSIVFDAAAQIDLSALPSGGHKFIRSVTLATLPDGKSGVTIQLAPGANYRDFTAGDRIIVDAQGPKSASVKTSEPKQESKAAEVKPEPKPAAKAEPKKVEPKAAPAPEAKPVEKKETKKAEEKPVEEKQAMPTIVDDHAAAPPPLDDLAPAVSDEKPDIISFSSTTATDMAVFTRGDRLWLVFGSAEIRVPPSINGPHGDNFTPMERIPLDGGIAFSTTLPGLSAMGVTGEGGGLVWRVKITPAPLGVAPVPMERELPADKSDPRGGGLSWKLGATEILTLSDPFVGDKILVAPVGDSHDFVGPARDLVDFAQLSSAIGAAIVPRSDDITATAKNGVVAVSKPDGLALSRVTDVNRRLIREGVGAHDDHSAPQLDAGRIFDFDRWMMGGIGALSDNQRILMSGMTNKDKSGVAQDLLTIAKMNVANDRGQEALGFLDYAGQLVPDLAQSPEFLALRGAAYALAGKYAEAFADFSAPTLKNYAELNYWRAYALAWLEDWRQAAQYLPEDHGIITSYPVRLQEKIGVKLAEIALRAGKVPMADAMLGSLDAHKDEIWPWTQAALGYLRGESLRQQGKPDEAIPAWKPLLTGEDDFYRVRAGLAATMLELQSGKITREQAIDRLEGLRYGWRGDELEARINYMLGKLYIEDKRYLKGFGILREAETMSPGSDIVHEISGYMRDTYKSLIMDNPDLSPLDAVTVYEEFSELAPVDAAGKQLTRRLAERLVDAELPDRAAMILQKHIDHDLEGLEKASVLARLGAVYLLNDDAEKAEKSLMEARDIFAAQNTPASAQQVRRIDLMRARALSQMGKSKEALTMLNRFEPNPDVNLLRADIAWQASDWENAAQALQDMMTDQDLDNKAAFDADQASLVLNRAVALNLAGNRVALANARQRYFEKMGKTPRAKMFDVITRPRQSALLSDRETLQSLVSEVDIFKDFLEDYRADDGAP